MCAGYFLDASVGTVTHPVTGRGPAQRTLNVRTRTAGLELRCSFTVAVIGTFARRALRLAQNSS